MKQDSFSVDNISLLIKPASADCNLACEYCFYMPKQELYPGKTRMDYDTLELLIRDYLAMSGSSPTLCWQGGEPTLMGLDFYKRVAELEKQYMRDDQRINHAFQTNGILLDEKWAEFLASENYLVGLSIDGRRRLHDIYRKDRKGNGTHDKVERTVKLFQQYGVEFNVLTVVNDQNVKKPEALFNYFMDLGIYYMQFIPCLEVINGQIAPFSAPIKEYGEFLCRIFDKWYNMGNPACYIRDFDEMLVYYSTNRHPSCTNSPFCNSTIVIEHNGDVYPCDFFVEPEWKLGNIKEKSLADMILSDKYKSFRASKQDIDEECLSCEYLNMCWGGCKKLRWNEYGERIKHSYYCQAYKQFYKYSEKYFKQLAATIKGESF